jgi:hypothetical protein
MPSEGESSFSDKDSQNSASSDSTSFNLETSSNETDDSDSSCNKNIHNYEALYNGSQISLKEFAITFFSIVKKHNINDASSNDILNLIKTILPANNNCPKKINSIRNFFTDNNDVDLYNACATCKTTTPTNKIENNTTCHVCRSELAQFAIFDILPQLTQILDNNKTKQIKSSVATAKKNLKTNPDMITSAMDGTVYREYLQAHNQAQHIISFNLNSACEKKVFVVADIWIDCRNESAIA